MARLSLKAVSSTALTAVTLLVATPGLAQIKEPGNHPDYDVEIEPHGLVAWDGEYWGDEGFGLGLRVSIPVVDNGPIKTINNNFAIGFGLDWAHFSDDCWGWGRWRNGPRPAGWDGDCSENDFILPAVAQWNFFFTPVVSAYAELGLAFEYATVSVDTNNFAGCGDFCEYDDSDLDLEPVFGVGGRFLFGDTAGLIVRLGWPYFSVGASILL